MIHQFKFESSNILMDIHSGSVHIVIGEMLNMRVKTFGV